MSAALGYVLLDPASGRTGAFAQGFAAGALLAMVTDTMLPEAYDVERVSTGALVAIGFAISLDALGDLRTAWTTDESHSLGDAPGCESMLAGSHDLSCIVQQRMEGD